MDIAEEDTVFVIDIKGLTGQLATELLGEVWEDEYMGYKYHEGDERVMNLFVLDEDFDTYYMDDDDGFDEY